MSSHCKNEKNSIDVVAAIIFYNNKILAAQRFYSTDLYTSLKFEFPGGKVKNNEELLTALKRELSEELDLKVKNFTYYFYNKFIYPNKIVNLYFYKCKIQNLNLKLKVHKCFKLLSIDKLRDVEWLEGDYLVIKKLEKEF